MTEPVRVEKNGPVTKVLFWKRKFQPVLSCTALVQAVVEPIATGKPVALCLESRLRRPKL